MQKDTHMHIEMTPLRKYVAMALAGSPDLEAGTAVTTLVSVLAYLLSLHDTYQATFLALIFGAVCALLPDILDFFWFRAASMGQENGDHHDRFSHSPLWIGIMGIVGYALGGPYFAAIGAFSLLWHFIHDSWLGDSPYFNWLNPIGRNRPHAASMPLLEWLQKWLQPTNRSIYETFLGATAVSVSIWINGFPVLGIMVGASHLAFCSLFWRYLRRTTHAQA